MSIASANFPTAQRGFVSIHSHVLQSSRNSECGSLNTNADVYDTLQKDRSNTNVLDTHSLLAPCRTRRVGHSDVRGGDAWLLTAQLSSRICIGQGSGYDGSAGHSQRHTTRSRQGDIHEYTTQDFLSDGDRASLRDRIIRATGRD